MNSADIFKLGPDFFRAALVWFSFSSSGNSLLIWSSCLDWRRRNDDLRCPCPSMSSSLSACSVGEGTRAYLQCAVDMSWFGLDVSWSASTRASWVMCSKTCFHSCWASYADASPVASATASQSAYSRIISTNILG